MLAFSQLSPGLSFEATVYFPPSRIRCSLPQGRDVEKSKLIYSKVRVGKTSYARSEIFAAQSLSVLPEKSLMRFLVDASISQGKAGVEAQLKMIDSISAHCDDEEKRVITYNRVAKILPSSQTSNSDSVLSSIQIGNGSNLDLGLKKAMEVVKNRKAEGPIFGP